jgi:hypothetical protein
MEPYWSVGYFILADAACHVGPRDIFQPQLDEIGGISLPVGLLGRDLQLPGGTSGCSY